MKPADNAGFIVRSVTRAKGGFREKAILAGPHTLQPSETWNDEHKVINVISKTEDAQGHKDSYAVDIVTRSICG